MDVTSASATEISELVRNRKLSAAEVTGHFLDRINSLDGQLNSFVTVNQAALEDAGAVDRAVLKGDDPGPLAGVPVAIKDLLCTEGLRTTACSRALENFVPPYSATIVTRLRKAGAIILGKTNLDEFGMGSSNESSHFGPVRNPWSVEHVPGGSSGGSAAALAARLAPAAIGTDTGGSIRQPASFCGLFGIKPTYGRVSRHGVIAFASSLDQAGPMGHSTLDCATILEVIAGHDRNDATTATVEVPRWTEQISGMIKGLRVGLPREYFSSAIDPDVSAALESTIQLLRELGAEVIDVSLPSVGHAVATYYLIATSEASSNLARYDGVRYGHRAGYDTNQVRDLSGFYSQNRGESFGAEVKRRIMLGTYALSSGYYEAFYRKASQVRRLMRNEYVSALSLCDVLLSPVSATPAFRLGEKISDPLKMYLNDIFTTTANLVGAPAMSVPVGFSSQGLPIGVQLMARHFDEGSLLNVSFAIESRRLCDGRRPNVI